MSIAECDEDIVVAMHEGRSMGCDLNLEDAYGFSFQDKVVRWFRSDFDFSRGLRCQERNEQEERSARFMAFLRFKPSTQSSPRRSSRLLFPSDAIRRTACSSISSATWRHRRSTSFSDRKP